DYDCAGIAGRPRIPGRYSHSTGRLGPLERSAGSRAYEGNLNPLRESRHHWRGGSGSAWPLGGRWVVRPGLGSASRSGLGSLSGWPVDLGRRLWMDLGQLRSVGLGAVSLRPLVSFRIWLGLVAWVVPWTLLLESRA